MRIWTIPVLATLVLASLGYAEEKESGGKVFVFSQPDEKLLEEADQLDVQYQKRGMTYNDRELNAYLQNVAGKLLKDNPAPEKVQWNVRALRDPMVNAFALPNGSIYINSGLLALLENESQLAGVMAHEISHVNLRHSYLYNRSVRKKMVLMHVLSAAGSAGGMFPSGSVFGMALQLASGVSQSIVAAMINGYSRENERDADKTGLDLLSLARFDPHAMPRTFLLLNEKLEVEPVETFYRTHPKLQERTTYTTAMADEQKIANPLGTSTEEYLAHVAGIIQYNVQADISSRRYRTAVARASRLTSWQRDNPAYVSLLADAYRELGARTAEPAPEEESGKVKSRMRNDFIKRTAEEEEKELLTTPSGQQAAEANRQKAEQLYRDAIQINPALPDSYRGLGMLFEHTGKTQEAINQYKEYLRLAPEAPDRLRIQRRVENLEKPVLQQ